MSTYQEVLPEVYAWFGKLPSGQCCAVSKKTGRRCQSATLAFVDIKGRCFVHSKRVPGTKEAREANSARANEMNAVVRMLYDAEDPAAAWEEFKLAQETRQRRVVRR